MVSDVPLTLILYVTIPPVDTLNQHVFVDRLDHPDSVGE